jgi:colanic acid biosynthesis glycosyl transferase WcaI
MNILVVTQYYWPENFRINDLVSVLVNRGHQVTVLTGIPNYPTGIADADFLANPSNYNMHDGANIIRVPMITRGKGGLKLVVNYISFALSASVIGVYKLRKYKFDSVFAFEPSPITVGLPAILLRKIKNAPLIFWALDLWPDTLKAIGVVRSKYILSVVGWLVSFIYKRCDLVLGQSESFLPHIKKYAGHDRIEYFPSWAESVFQYVPTALLTDEPVKSQFNVMFAGNIGEAQDFSSVLYAMELLKNDSRIHWTIVGSGRLSEWLENNVISRGLSDSVTLAGRHPVEKMPEFFQQADALLVSLKDEPIFSMTIPGKLQAYLMADKPILAMLNGDGAKIIIDSGCGIVCEAGNGQCLADAVCRLIEMTDEERLMMGNRGRELSEREFDRNMLISRLEDWMIQLSTQ